jgi:hypothetical protein
MPARHRHHHSSGRRNTFTITLESCSRSAGICVHDALETVTTNDRNMQSISIFGKLSISKSGSLAMLARFHIGSTSRGGLEKG